MNLSKSKYCNALQCKKSLWLNKYKPLDPESPILKKKEPIFENGKKVGELAKGLFGDYEDVQYNKNLNVMIEKTKELMQDEPNIITEASFTFDNNFCSVDILKNDLDGVEIYEVKSSKEIKDIYYEDVAFQYYVLSCLDLNVKKVCIVHINKEYIRGKDLEIDKFFKIEDVTDIAKEKWNQTRINIELIKKYMKEHGCDNEPIKKIGMHCSNPYPCDFWEYCTKDLPENNVFDIMHMHDSTKFKKYYDGKILFEDLRGKGFGKLTDRQQQQINCQLDGSEIIKKKEIKEFLDELEYPLSFLDYETIWPPIPVLEGTKPYQQVPFQYSLHIRQDKDSPLDHKQFLAEGIGENMIREFAENLMKSLPKKGSIIVYNKKFECERNKEIGLMLDLEDEMEEINCRIKDIMEPFENRYYYTKEMKGSHSLKYVLPALYPDDPDLNYDNLQLIHHGGEAPYAFETLNEKTLGEQKRIKKALYDYCRLDTLALFKIYKKLKEVIGEEK